MNRTYSFYAHWRQIVQQAIKDFNPQEPHNFRSQIHSHKIGDDPHIKLTLTATKEDIEAFEEHLRNSL
jgi:hypothetical protein